ncbi:Protein GLUTAMINE DUMPER like [Melia azedarach]|uniref:Protein GLUTAMINE DUMPER like n=2 Tax=Melia azedarach TaxID=155640 RepID=A0ACC1XF07_MELAZ|nr:Protein GLUTAMINE DUMPER like [Melia azedarach]KAJ4709388.1 Protein GLUTAMINE DUMPER like [Melia azedarach]
METPRQPSHVAHHNVTQTHSPWHSPVPYLFGGLAAMLGLIAFALLILACSYWKLSGYLEGDNGAADRDLEAGEGKNDETQKPPQVFEEKFLVIMAGELKPTFLATPMSSRSSSFGDDSNKSCSCSDKTDESKEGVKESGDQVQTGNTDTNGSSDQTH